MTIKIGIFDWYKQKKRKKAAIKAVKNAHRPRIDIDMEQLRLMKLAGLSNREIARRLHCSEGTVRNRLNEHKEK